MHAHTLFTVIINKWGANSSVEKASTALADCLPKTSTE